MPLDPVAVTLVKLYDDLGVRIRPDSTPESAHAALNRIAKRGKLAPVEVHAVDNRSIPGPDGEIPIRIYRPNASAPLPALMWIHGGGWVTGSIETEDHLCRLLCDAAQVVVVAVDYRLAPETKFPGAVDDCVASWRWLTAHAGELGVDAARIAIGGDSAGGNLAAVVALIAKAEGTRAPTFQLLVYPVTDREFERPSMIDNATGYFLEAEGMRWFWDHYARTPADFADWRFSPLRAPDLAGLPPAFVVTAEYDPLHDQGEAYGERLRDAGVPTAIVRADGMFHGFFGMFEFLPNGRGAWDQAITALQSALDHAAVS